MTEPSAIWSFRRIVFDNSISLTQQVILSHGAAALQAVIKRIDRLHELATYWPNFVEFHPHSEIPSTLSELAFNQGVASTVMFNDSSKTSKENSATYKLRLERLAYVEQKCRNVSITLLRDRKIRNSLTHIDEHLAKALARPKTGWFIDSAIGRRDQLAASQHGIEIQFCRTYISSEDVLLHLGSEISLKDLRREAVEVLKAVFEEQPSASITQPNEGMTSPLPSDSPGA